MKNESSNTGDYLYAAGWGQTERLASSPTKLKLRVALVDKTECKEIYARARVTLTDKQICAGGEDAKNLCKGIYGIYLSSSCLFSQLFCETAVYCGIIIYNMLDSS